MMSRGRTSSAKRFITCIPAVFARRTRSAYTAGIVPFPGRPRPRTSVKQFMEFAVNIPEQEPQPGQELPSISASSSSLMRFAFLAPTASNTVFKSLWLMESIGPPDTKIHGRFRRIAAINIPGTILSQFGMNTRASKQCAFTIHSMVSAISSRELKEKCIPSWPMAIPSQTPMVLNSIGVPPAARTPSFTARAIVCKCICPGATSLKEFTTPINGRRICSSLYPSAFKRERCGACSTPAFTLSEFMIFLLMKPKARR